MALLCAVVRCLVLETDLIRYYDYRQLFIVRIFCCPARHKRLPENIDKKKDRRESLSFSIYARRCGLQRVFQRLTCTEFRRFGSRNNQFFTGLRVAAFAFSAFAHVESAEANQSYGVAFFQSGGNSLGKTIQCLAGSSLGNVSFLSNRLNQFRLVHIKSLSS